VRQLTLAAVVLMVCALSTTTRGWSAAHLDPQPPDQQIPIVSFEDSPLTMTEGRVLSVKRPVAVVFAVTNATNRSIATTMCAHTCIDPTEGRRGSRAPPGL
jgi:hypothetical protein